jgi:WD40 repeat protein
VILYDIRTNEKAIELKLPEEIEVKGQSVPVQQVSFSNKGYHLAVSWKGFRTCRIYSIHKQNHFADVSLIQPIVDHAFDKYGQYLATSDGTRIQVFYFKDFALPVADF